MVRATIAVSCFLMGCADSRFSYSASQFAAPTTPGNASQPSGSPGVTPLPPPRPSGAPNEQICPASSTVVGFDVSDYDPGTNWAAVKTSGSGFTFIKATEGLTVVNSLFASDWQAAKATAAVYRGAYHFFHPAEDPTAQAQFFLATIGSLAVNDLPAMLDFETTDGVSVATQVANALTWLQVIETATGKTPIIYADPSFINALGNPGAFAHYPLFVANYDVNCPSIPAPWSTWLFWQKGIGPVVGVQSAEADQDEFNGSMGQLGAFVVTGQIPGL